MVGQKFPNAFIVIASFLWFEPNQSTMTSYRTTEQNVLIELLSKLTVEYTGLLKDKGDQQQVDKLHKEIVAIQKEISLREKFHKYSNASTDFILFRDGEIV
jgi:hypothetical protein